METFSLREIQHKCNPPPNCHTCMPLDVLQKKSNVYFGCKLFAYGTLTTELKICEKLLISCFRVSDLHGIRLRLANGKVIVTYPVAQ